MTSQNLIERYQAGPAKVRESLEGLTGSELRYKYDPAKWSAKEIAIHIADMDLVAAFRMKRIIAEPGAHYPGVDQDLWATGLCYQQREIEQSLQLLELTRKEMATILTSLPESAWEQTGVHDSAGEQSLRALVEGYTNHLEQHVAQILAIRKRLGR